MLNKMLLQPMCDFVSSRSHVSLISNMYVVDGQ